MYNANYDKDTFTEMIRDFLADHSPEYDDLEVDEPHLVDGHWEADAEDETTTYTLTDDGAGFIVINYGGTK